MLHGSCCTTHLSTHFPQSPLAPTWPRAECEPKTAVACSSSCGCLQAAIDEIAVMVTPLASLDTSGSGALLALIQRLEARYFMPLAQSSSARHGLRRNEA
jgi:hypothetical protein